jgi:tetraacyldisaccharide 4'-kinase
MLSWKIILLPFSLLYGLILSIRNFLFDKGVFKSFKIPVKSIVVGNLSVGGTGKTPHVYYISSLLSTIYKTAILSRGYGRKSKGYIEVTENTNSSNVGDESLLLKLRLKNQVDVAVCESREFGVKKIIEDFDSEVIVLDDAFQHRKVTPGMSILLTEFDQPYYDDYPMPMGRLREFKSGKNRANVLVFTKCPDKVDNVLKNKLIVKSGFDASSVFFSRIVYGEFVSFSDNLVQNIKNVLLVTAIANDTKIVKKLSESYNVKTIKFKDHHLFSKEDIQKIHLKFELLPKSYSVIVTTEKDFVKLKEFDEVVNGEYPWCFLPINIEIDRKNEFNQLIKDYVGTI